MTTTAATTNTSASTSTPPKDSPGLHDYEDDDDDVDGTSKSIVEQQKKQEHQHNHHIEQKCQNNLAQSPSPQQQQPPSPPSQNRPQSPSQPQSIGKVGVSNTPIANASPTTTAPPTQSTISCAPTATVNETPINQQLEQSTSSQQQLQQSTTISSNNNTELKRPMNAFLLFCKRQRSLVREKYPNLENRGITKILGDWWSKLDKEQRSKYTDLARQHKEAFMKANPDFKWCKTPNASSINNNISINDTDNESCNNSSTNQHQQQSQHSQRLQQNNRQPPASTNVELLSLQSIPHPMDVVHHSSNSMDIMLKSRQQLEAPKPPKKTFSRKE
uniref:HMG box transcription factor BBX n=1 Tax=Aceria tosichella TaxID=561515 RepID=A0A6G1S4P1_9ACAR